MNGIEFTLADPDFYVPPERWTSDSSYAPSDPPAAWERQDRGVWTYWTPAATVLAAQGWKIHVSAQLERTQAVLDVVAGICAEHETAFKHLRTRECFLWLHHKHGPRSQSGKFCAIYPRDIETAGRLLRALESELADEQGPYVLTDRRFGTSSVVSYRYGGFTPRSRIRPDGYRTALITAPDGSDILDQRLARFHLPEGIDDPFASTVVAPPTGEPVSLHGYTFTSVLQYSNAGGAYRAVAPGGRAVFVKEARQDNGYTWSGRTAAERLHDEQQTLIELHALLPGICPEPLDYFRHWENQFLVTELIPGTSLWAWANQRSPLIRTRCTAADIDEYYDRCRRILDALEAQIGLLHQAGYVFVDLNPRNILIDADLPRLIDFEEARRIDRPRPPQGAEGYLPKHLPVSDSGTPDDRYMDTYALAAIAQLLLHPLHPVLDRNPEAVAHLAVDLPRVPADLWHRATRLRPTPATRLLPTPQAVAAEPERWLQWLRQRIADGLERSVKPDGGELFPGTPQSHGTNQYSVAHGLAGIVHALDRAGRPPSPAVVGRLIDGATEDQADLPPGLFSGLAGISWVLARLGHVDAARELLAAADRHPLSDQDASLAHGSAGIALAHLDLFRLTGDDAELTRAGDLLGAIPDGPALTALLGDDDPTGWQRGRPGIALVLHYLNQFTGDRSALHRGLRLLRADLDRAHTAAGGMKFPVSQTDSRIEPYLATGSAGFALVAGRYLATPSAADPLADGYRRCLETLRATTAPVLPGLFSGLSGIGHVLADLGHRTGDADLTAAAGRSARALFKYTVPRDGDIYFLSAGRRICADLADGSAGVLLFLDGVVNRRSETLFTIDRPPGHSPTEVPDIPGSPTARGELRFAADERKTA